MTAPKFASHAEARKAGWFSRRHQTSEPHREAQDDRRMRGDFKQTLVDEQKARTLAKRGAK